MGIQTDSVIGSFSVFPRAAEKSLKKKLICLHCKTNLKDKKYFIADKILAKHDENYMPPEVSEALEKSN